MSSERIELFLSSSDLRVSDENILPAMFFTHFPTPNSKQSFYPSSFLFSCLSFSIRNTQRNLEIRHKTIIICLKSKHIPYDRSSMKNPLSSSSLLNFTSFAKNKGFSSPFLWSCLRNILFGKERPFLSNVVISHFFKTLTRTWCSDVRAQRRKIFLMLHVAFLGRFLNLNK